MASERHGIPLGWAIDGAHRNDVRLLEPTLDTIDQVGLLADIGVLHLDRSYDSPQCGTGSASPASTSSRSNAVTRSTG